MSAISVSLDNPYGQVIIPRAKLRGDESLVIGNPGALGKAEGGTNEAQAPPPYTVKEAEPEEEMRCPACCYSCRRRPQ
ncbi:hypothetical protein NHX12_027010 [Muraenolepis orangiensis]|uniref:Uncharacterized protein n=1 Tax=Muraenolepis orangiensis TaxID=630683 RepID=A0A9Q0INE6_9TELE|nr:hypothetical protein NHX12_027010 [Muraenolepis orangiensis]